MKNSIEKKKNFSLINFRFDLKGSKVNRQVLPPKLGAVSLQFYGLRYVLKDNDFRYITKFKKPNLVNINIEDKRKIMAKLREDAGFLESLNIMDYSLLFAIEANYDNVEDKNDDYKRVLFDNDMLELEEKLTLGIGAFYDDQTQDLNEEEEWRGSINSPLS